MCGPTALLADARSFTSAFTRLLNHEALPLSESDLLRHHEHSPTFRPRFVLLPADDGPLRAHLVLPIPMTGPFAGYLIGQSGEQLMAIARYSRLGPTEKGRLWFMPVEKAGEEIGGLASDTWWPRGRCGSYSGSSMERCGR